MIKSLLGVTYDQWNTARYDKTFRRELIKVGKKERPELRKLSEEKAWAQISYNKLFSTMPAEECTWEEVAEFPFEAFGFPNIVLWKGVRYRKEGMWRPNPDLPVWGAIYFSIDTTLVLTLRVKNPRPENRKGDKIYR